MGTCVGRCVHPTTPLHPPPFSLGSYLPHLDPRSLPRDTAAPPLALSGTYQPWVNDAATAGLGGGPGRGGESWGGGCPAWLLLLIGCVAWGKLLACSELWLPHRFLRWWSRRSRALVGAKVLPGARLGQPVWRPRGHKTIRALGHSHQRQAATRSGLRHEWRSPWLGHLLPDS